MLCASRRASPSAPPVSQSPRATAARKPSTVPSPGAAGVARRPRRGRCGRRSPPMSALRQGVSPYGSMPWRAAMSASASGVRDAAISRSRPLQRFTRAPLRPSRTLNRSSMRSTVSMRQCAVHVEQRVREVVHDAGLAQAGDQVVDRGAGALGRGEGALVEAERHHVHPDPVLREPGVELGAQKRAGQVGDGQRAVEGVVVADGDEVHAPAVSGRVHVERARRTTPARAAHGWRRGVGSSEQRECTCRSARYVTALSTHAL